MVRAMGGAGAGKAWGAHQGVQVAELEGHVSQSAVYLIHVEVRTGAGGSETEEDSARRLSPESGCYHTRSVNVL